MRRMLRVFATLAFAVPAVAHAQRGGSITGTVLDETGKPIADAEIAASADNAHTKTDSVGRFLLSNLDGGFYTVRARRIGFQATRVTTDLEKNGHIDLKIELKVRPAMLDSIVVVADGGSCPDHSYVGFLCRKNSGKGVYLTDDDIFDKNAREIGDIFRNVDGFRIETRPSPFGRIPVPLSTKASQCLNALVDGRPSASTNQVPRFADQMIAVEIYAAPGDVPKEYQRYVWGNTGRQTQAYASHTGSAATDRCALVIYWTHFS